MSKLKIGQKVKVTGEIVDVDEKDDELPYRVRLSDDTSNWFSKDKLEVIPEPELKSPTKEGINIAKRIIAESQEIDESKHDYGEAEPEGFKGLTEVDPNTPTWLKGKRLRYKTPDSIKIPEKMEHYFKDSDVEFCLIHTQNQIIDTLQEITERLEGKK